jgi:hypothetical protein
MRLGIQLGPLNSWSTQYIAFRDLAPFMRFWSGPKGATLSTPDATTYRADMLPENIPDGCVLKGLLELVPVGQYKVTVEPSDAIVSPTLTDGVLTVEKQKLVMFVFAKAPTSLRIEQTGEGDGLLTDTARNLLSPFAGGSLRFMVAQGLNTNNPHEAALHVRQCDYQWHVAGMPVKAMITMCEETHMRPWFCVSPMATEDEARAFIDLVRQLSPSWMKPIFENANEVWNGNYIWGKYYKGLGATNWQGIMAKHVERTALIGTIAHSLMGDTAHVTLGVQGASAGTCPKSMPSDIDGIAVAPYLRAPAGCTDLDALFDALPVEIEKTAKAMTEWRSRAEGLGVALDVYESGQSLLSADAVTEEMFIEANRDERMVGVYQHYYAMLAENLSVDAPCIAHCWIKKRSSGNFGIMEFIEDVQSPKWRALLSVLDSMNASHWLHRAGQELHNGRQEEAGSALVRAAERMM